MPVGGIGGDGRSPLFRPLQIAKSGLSAQRRRMEAIARNIANAETTRTPEGGPYRRRVVRLEPADRTSPSPVGLDDPEFGEILPEPRPGGVRVAGVEADPAPGKLVYEPGHPDADEDGYVRYPNVDVTREMTDLMLARRGYEANATVFEVAKAMLRRALEI